MCASCNKATTTIFMPDGVRPVYCKDCLSKKKEEKRVDLEKRQVAKEIERKHLEETSVLVSKAPAMSLSDLSKIKPVDFRGREIKTRPVEIKDDSTEIEATEEEIKYLESLGLNMNESSDLKEHELKEGQDMPISSK
ncbi:MAG: CxxC-x17-CxxC domain-containing protein [Patescibacteria group bacterium]